jgi:hypothetical protein
MLISKQLHDLVFLLLHVRWVPCHHGMAHPQVVDGGDGLQIRRIAADKGLSSSFGVGHGANSSSLITKDDKSDI